MQSPPSIPCCIREFDTIVYLALANECPKNEVVSVQTKSAYYLQIPVGSRMKPQLAPMARGPTANLDGLTAGQNQFDPRLTDA